MVSRVRRAGGAQIRTTRVKPKKKTTKKTVKSKTKVDATKVGSIPRGKAAKKGRVTVIAGGKVFDVKKTLAFQQTIDKIAKKQKLSRFHVYADGEEVKDPNRAPKDFGGISEHVIITAYDKGG